MDDTYSFSCQRCKQPIKLDSSLSDLSQSSFDMIASSYPEKTPTSTTSTSSNNGAHLPPSISSAFPQSKQHLERYSSFRQSSVARSGGGVIQDHSSTSSQNKQHAPSVTQNTSNLKTHPTMAPSESFVMLDESTLQMNPSTSKQQVGNPTSSTLSSTSSPSSTNKNSNNNALSAKSKSGPVSAPEKSKLLLTLSLFNLLSSHGDIDHPLCVDCAEMLRGMMATQMEELKAEKEVYLMSERELSKAKRDAPSKSELESEIAQLQASREKALHDLSSVEAEREQLEKELADLDLEEERVAAEEAKFWEDYNEYQANINTLSDASRSLMTRYEQDVRELEKLRRTNVMTDAFCIGIDAGIATINGLRLGRLPAIVVDWPEINAAWGQTLFLLHTLAKRLGYTFENYQLIPLGSFSRIERTTGDKSVMELYGSGEFAFGRLFQNRRFDFAMVAFLDCLGQLMEYAEKLSSNDLTSVPRTFVQERLKLPHRIVKDKIGNVSIKLQFASDVTWTRALRHVLLNMKMLLAFVSNRTSPYPPSS